MKKWLQWAVVVLAMGVASAGAEELFPNGKAKQMERFSELPSSTTIGGYPIYDGGRTWWLVKNDATTNNLDVRIGHAQMISPMGNDYFAEMSVAASMGGGSESGYFSADMCSLSKPHLFMLNKASGQNDNCLLIDPYAAKIGGKDTMTLLVKIRNSQSSWRLYDLSLLLSVEKMGFPGTSLSDWREAGIDSDPKKKAFLAKLTVWAKQLQDAVNTAMAFSKPQDAFAKVPPIQTLLDEAQPGQLVLK